MGRLVAIVGVSGVGKTTLVRALAASGDFAAGMEQHEERPFQRLFKEDTRYALANQLDYLIHRADEERRLRLDPRPALVDGGLDLDLHGFTRLFHARGWLTEAEFDLCRRFHALTRSLLPPPDLVVHLTASQQTVRERLAARDRINIASAEDAEWLDRYILEWLASLPADCMLRIDAQAEDRGYASAVKSIQACLADMSPLPG